MTYEEFNEFCASLHGSHYVMQWGNSHVWKVSGKVFAIGGWGQEGPAYTFKVTRLSFEILSEQPGLRPAPYLASRGFSWIQHHRQPGLDDEALRDYITASYKLVAKGLSKKKQRELGLIDN